MKNKIIIALLIVFLLIGFVIGCQCHKNPSEALETIDTVTVTRVDTFWKDTTITKTEFIPKKVEVIRHDTIIKNTVLPVERKLYEDTLINDNDSIVLCAYVQGINAKLDSTTAQWKKHKEIVTNTVTITKYVEKPKKIFVLKPQVGFGYGVFNKKPDMYIGFGVSINI